MTTVSNPKALIYVVDDDQNIRRALGIILRKESYQVVECSNGADLQQHLLQKVPDMVFLDVMMPGESGFDLCTHLRMDTKFSSMAIFLVTARGMKRDVQHGFAVGADEYVLKPFFTKDVLALVERYAMKLATL